MCVVDDLVSRLRAGDGAAFDEVYRQYHVRVFGFLARLVGRRDLAHDLLQETFIRLATRASDLREDTRLDAWLFTVARNLSLSFLRWRLLDSERLSRLQRKPEEQPPSPFDLATASQLERRLELAVAALPVRYREVVLLVLIEGLEPRDAAAVLRLSPEAVRQRLSRGRAMIEKRIVEDDEAPLRRTEGER
jgi:RNA polymerase sigma-70 factor (ECF subfamily)